MCLHRMVLHGKALFGVCGNTTTTTTTSSTTTTTPCIPITSCTADQCGANSDGCGGNIFCPQCVCQVHCFDGFTQPQDPLPFNFNQDQCTNSVCPVECTNVCNFGAHGTCTSHPCTPATGG